MKIATIAAVVFVVLSAPVRGGENDVSIKATPQVAIALPGTGAYIRVIIRVKRHPDNRNLVFNWESDYGEIGRKDSQLEGEDSQTIFDTKNELYFGKQGLRLTPGHYTLTATVDRAVGDDPRASTQVTVQGGL
ncbi:MAG: hypothetical protein Q8R55_03565 [Candidatus Taylorbacteria bacterium]|nr:hypothetical protein [Candidatus Taylorbacteria bacterium]